jgi:N-acetylglucosaminyl-diphospho-decaprenol L-rhamnosyltransferase
MASIETGTTNGDGTIPEPHVPSGLPTLEIVIVNWNSGVQLRKCLESIATARQDNFRLNRVVVVDNASADGSIEILGNLAFQLKIIRNKTNRGFAAACNQGARGSGADYLLFLNPDTRLSLDSLGKPIGFMENPNNRKIGMVGIQLIDENGHISRTCARMPSAWQFLVQITGFDRVAPRLFSSHLMREWNHEESREVDHVMGAFFLVRQKLFEELGGFDERFFVYLEDVDFSSRAHRAGWRSFYMADVKAYHKGGGTSEQIKSTRLFYSLRSRILYSYKHFSRASATALTLATLFLEPLIRSIWSLIRFAFREFSETLRAYVMLWREMPQLVGILKQYLPV